MRELVRYFACLSSVIVRNNLFVLSIRLFRWLRKLAGWCGVSAHSAVVLA